MLIIEQEEVYKICKTEYEIKGTPYIDFGGMIPLYKGDKNCVHEIVSGDNWSGIKCRKCKGWYCAC